MPARDPLAVRRRFPEIVLVLVSLTSSGRRRIEQLFPRFNAEEARVAWTTTFQLIAGIMRYLQITFVEQDSGSPTAILYRDKFILITILGWIISFYLIIYNT